MTTLIERLQSLTGPDREVDAEIALANGWQAAITSFSAHWVAPDGEVFQGPPRYTESLDAALTLVPPAFGFKIETDDWQAQKHTEHLSDSTFASIHDIKRHRECIGECDDKAKRTGIYALTHFSARAATAPVALLIAIMKAKEETTP